MALCVRYGGREGVFSLDTVAMINSNAEGEVIMLAIMYNVVDDDIDPADGMTLQDL